MLTLDQQIEAYSKRLEEHPTSLVFLPLAELHYQHGKLVEATEICRMGIRHHGSLTKAKFLLGELLYHQGQLTEAADWFRAVLGDYHDHEGAKQFLAKISQQGALPNSIPSPESSGVRPPPMVTIKKSPAPPPEPLDPQKSHPVENADLPGETFQTPSMAELYVKQGLVPEAIALYRKILESQPDRSDLRSRLAELEHPEGVEKTVTHADLMARLDVLKKTLADVASEIQRIERTLQ